MSTPIRSIDEYFTSTMRDTYPEGFQSITKLVQLDLYNHPLKGWLVELDNQMDPI